jgi:hypothetical protein
LSRRLVLNLGTGLQGTEAHQQLRTGVDWPEPGIGTDEFQGGDAVLRTKQAGLDGSPAWVFKRLR